MNQTTVSFPGLGIDSFTLNKVAFSVGKLEVRWYGIIITLGIVLAFLYAFWRGKRNENVVMDDVIDIGLWTVSLGIVGARLYYVLTTLDEYDYSSLYDVIAIWEGGLAIYGGIIGGCIGILIACKIKKIRWQKIFDMVAPGVVIAQSLGRWGNFFNGEAFGYAIGDTTRFYFFNTEYRLPSGEGTLFHTLRMGLSFTGREQDMVYFHPTFLYESVWNLLGFILLNIFYKRKKFDAQIALMYFAWYGFGRMFIEGFRTDSLYIPGTTLRISQCLGLVCFVCGLGLLIFFLVRHARTAPAVAEGAAMTATDAEALIQVADPAADATGEESNEDHSEANENNESNEENTDPAQDVGEEDHDYGKAD